MTAIAFVFAWLLAMLTGQPVPAVTAPVAVTAHTSAPAPRAVAATPSHGPAPADGARSSVPEQRPASSATVAPTPQLPEEVTGRQIDCTDGQVGTEDADGVVHCP